MDAQLQEEAKASRSKRPYSHTRLGCRTCKSVAPHKRKLCVFLTFRIDFLTHRFRKIRCDEALPICHNCIKADRPCDRASRLTSTSALVFKQPLTVSHFRPSQDLIGLTGDDMTYLDVFRHRLVHGIVGTESRLAWKRLILQSLHEVPAFRHVAVAFSAIYGLLDGSRCTSAINRSVDSLPVPSKDLGLRHYNMSIKGMQDIIIRGDRSSVNRALLCILLCICFELRINSPHIALMHIEHGLNILERNIKSTASLVDDDLLLAFAKLDLQASIFLGYRPPKVQTKYVAGITLACAGETPETDKEYTCLLSDIFSFIRTKANRYRYHREGSVPSHLYAEAKDLEDEVERFRSKHLQPQIPGLIDVAGLSQQQRVLWIKCLTMNILVATSLSMDEMIYDQFLPDFITIIALAESIVCSLPDTTRLYRDFNLDMSILYPVFLTALSCRSPLVRRKAIELMVKVPFDEGVWDGSSGKKYSELLMRLEEDRVDLDFANLEGIGPLLIPEWSRIRVLDVQPETAERYSTLFLRRNKRTGNWEDLVQAMVW